MKADLRLGALLCAFFFAQSISLLAQGSLSPPGAPAPLFKTLQQVEPRTDVQATPAPTGVDTTNAAYHFIINRPGSYYLSANVEVTKTSGIQINAEGVTLDLNGFQISRTSGSGGNGIEITAISHRASVNNGTITGFSQGVVCLFASGTYARNGRLMKLSVANCTTYGLVSGYNWLLDHCVAHDCSGNAAIQANSGTTLVDCSAHNNTGTIMIRGESGCVLTRCNAYKNNNSNGNAISVVDSTLSDCNASNNTAGVGIFANSCSLSNCTANGNTRSTGGSSGIQAYNSTLNGCDASNNTSTSGTNYFNGAGINAAYSKITHCTVSSNLGDGMTLDFDSYVADNHCYNNGAGAGDGAGIHVTGQRNRIESNNLSANDRGLDIAAVGNLIIKNSAKLNTLNYNIIANNHYGPIVDATNTPTAAVTTNSAAPGTLGTTTSTDPWANFIY